MQPGLQISTSFDAFIAPRERTTYHHLLLRPDSDHLIWIRVIARKRNITSCWSLWYIMLWNCEIWTLLRWARRIRILMTQWIINITVLCMKDTECCNGYAMLGKMSIYCLYPLYKMSSLCVVMCCHLLNSIATKVVVLILTIDVAAAFWTGSSISFSNTCSKQNMTTQMHYSTTYIIVHPLFWIENF